MTGARPSLRAQIEAVEWAARDVRTRPRLKLREAEGEMLGARLEAAAETIRMLEDGRKETTQ